MAKQFDSFEDHTRKFAEKQHMFFVGSADVDGRVNVSPKGSDAMRILGPNRLIWRNLTGSGNETAAHLRGVNRLTVMWCGFETQPLILRAYGSAKTIHRDDAEWAELDAHFTPHVGARQIYDMSVEMVQTSCGYAVPYFDFKGQRDTLDKWSETKGPEGIHDYWEEKNLQTIDKKDTGMKEHL